MSKVWKRSSTYEILENGWQTRQRREKNRTHNRSMQLLQQIFQSNIRQKEDLISTNASLFIFSFFRRLTKIQAILEQYSCNLDGWRIENVWSDEVQNGDKSQLRLRREDAWYVGRRLRFGYWKKNSQWGFIQTAGSFCQPKTAEYATRHRKLYHFLKHVTPYTPDTSSILELTKRKEQ